MVTRSGRGRGIGRLAARFGFLVVLVAAPAAAGEPPCDFIVATRARVGNASSIGGRLGANEPEGFVKLGRSVVAEDGTRLAGDRVVLGNGSSVFDVAANDPHLGRGAAVRGAITGVQLPLIDPFCSIGQITPSSTDVHVRRGEAPRTLNPGAYGAVHLENGTTLRLLPGSHHFARLYGGKRVVIETLPGGPVTVGVAENVRIGNGGSFGPAPGAPTPTLEVAGDAVGLGRRTRLQANLVAPTAALRLSNGGELVGEFCAERFTGGRRVRLECAADTMPSTTTTSTSSTTPTTTTTSTTALTTTSSTTAPSTTTTTTTTSTTAPTTTTSTTAPTTTTTTTSTTTSTTTTSTTAPTTTTTTTTSTSTTVTFPPLCGNGALDPGESCDDGNNDDRDPCPADCRFDACTPDTEVQEQFTVNFLPPLGAEVAGLDVLVDYPEGKVSVPGSGTSLPVGTISGRPSGTVGSAVDYDHALFAGFGRATSFPAGRFFLVRYNPCSGAPAPVPGDFTCTVLVAVDPFAAAVRDVTCSVAVP